VGEGVQAGRLSYGALFGYRAALSDDWSIGVDGSFRHLPVFFDAGGTVADLPGFSDASTLLNFGLSLNWNL
jgi:3-deoxy-D-manno-octulosonic acid (KDO) 8-phosphate synthase